jgi:hypothetical protein
MRAVFEINVNNPCGVSFGRKKGVAPPRGFGLSSALPEFLRLLWRRKTAT